MKKLLFLTLILICIFTGCKKRNKMALITIEIQSASLTDLFIDDVHSGQFKETFVPHSTTKEIATGQVVEVRAVPYQIKPTSMKITYNNEVIFNDNAPGEVVAEIQVD